MAVQLLDLKRDRRTIAVPINVGTDADGADVFESLTVTYRPSAYTPNTELDFNEKLKSEWKSEMGLAFLTTLVVEWDLMEGDAVVPLEKDTLAELPTPFITAVIHCIAEDMGKDRGPSNGS